MRERGRDRETFPYSLAEIPRKILIWPSLGFMLFFLGTITVCGGLRGRVGIQTAEYGWRTWGRPGSHFYSSPALDGPRRITRDEGGLVP